MVFCTRPAPATEVAALTVLDRLLVALHRAGCQPIYVVAPHELPRLRRAPALGVRFTTSPEPPPLAGPVMIASDDWLLTVADVRAAIAQHGRLQTPTGRLIPGGVVASLAVPIEETLAQSPAVIASTVAHEITDPATARSAERALWVSLTSANDGFVDRHFNRQAGRPLSKLLIRTSVTPNQVSVCSTLIGLVAAGLFASGRPSWMIVAALLLQLSAVIDCVDGDIARVVFKESPLGKWIDLVGDQFVHIGVFVGLGLGLWRAQVDAPVLALGLSAGLGVIISFFVVLRSQRMPASSQSGLLKRILNAATNRDFSVLLLALAVIGRLEWFLWLAGVGVHVFWLLAFSLTRGRPVPAS